MADMPTIIDGNGFGGFNSAGMGAGFIGGLVLGSIWNGGGFGGWGGNRGGQAVADVSLANAIEHVSDQVNQGTIAGLQNTNTLQNTINQGTIAGMQSAAGISEKICGATMGLAQQIDTNGDQTVAAINASTMQAMQTAQATNDRLCAINNNITTQGYENRLQSQALAAQLAEQHAQLSRQIYEENCRDRELQREIQSQAVRDQLTQAQAQNAALTAQINLSNQLAALAAQLKPTTTTAAA